MKLKQPLQGIFKKPKNKSVVSYCDRKNRNIGRTPTARVGLGVLINCKMWDVANQCFSCVLELFISFYKQYTD